jgi:autoinducer 2 (AI-2) kinase
MLSWVGAHIFNAREMSLPVGTLAFSHLAAGETTARRHLLRAVVEGNAFGLRANLEQVEAVGGPAEGPLCLGGGLTRSPFFAQLIADVCGRVVTVAPHPEATALGAALCAGVGAGVFADVAEAAASLASNGRTLEPDLDLTERYSEIYSTWREAHDVCGEFDTKLRAHAMPAVLAKEDAAPAHTPAARVHPRILVTADLDAASLAALQRLGEVEYAPFRQKMRLLTGDSLVTALAGVNVLIAEVDVVDGASMAKLPDLRVVATCRGDAVNVDVEAATLLGIPVLNTPGRNADAVADLAVGFMLMLSRKLGPANDFLRQPGDAGDMGRMGKAFGTLRGRELWRKTVGLVGFGAVGRKVAERLEGFGARVLVADPFLPDADVLRAGAEPADLATLLAQSDLVSLHAPVNDATRGLIGAAELAALKPGACLVNTARAALLDHEALVQALADGRLGGAALDVFPVEPPGSDDPLLAFDNVVATPHVGGNTEDVAAHQGEIVVADLERLLRNERPKHLLNPESFATFDWSRPRAEPDAEALARVTAGPGPAVTDLQKDTKEKREGSGATTTAPPAPDEDHAVPASLAPLGAAARTARTMAAIVADFVERIATRGALDRFATGRDVTLHFNLLDLNEAFWFRVREGSVTAGRGAPDAEAEVQLRLSADVFDGMFTNRLNPMQAAMEGRISFAGDTAKAMSLQEFQADLSNLYQEARESVGDPGDLAALSVGPSGAAPPVTQGDPRVELVRVVGELYAQELITATGGNVSVRIPGTDELWITPSQLFKGDLAPEVLVRIDLDGHSLDEGTRSASSESLMHGAVYRNRPNAGAVIHAHAPNATILVNSDLPFLPVSTEAAFFGNIPRIPFIMPGTRELANAVGEGIREEWAVLMKNHGLLVAGRSLRRAADMAEIIERSCEIILGCRAQGVEPPVLPDDIVETLRKMGDLVA